MDNHQERKLNSSAGFGIIDVLVAALVTSVLFYAMISAMGYMKAVEKAVEYDGVHQDLRATLLSILTDENVCSAALGGKIFTNTNNSPPISLATFNVGSALILKQGDSKDGLVVTSMKLLSDATNSIALADLVSLGSTEHRYLANFELVLTKPKALAGNNPTYTDKISLTVYTDSTNFITRCFAGADPVINSAAKILESSCISIGGIFDNVKSSCIFPNCSGAQYLSYQPSKGTLECRNLVRLCILTDSGGLEIGEGFQTAISVAKNTWSNCVVQSCKSPYTMKADLTACM